MVWLECSLEPSGQVALGLIALRGGQRFRRDAKQHLMQVGELEETARGPSQ